MLAEIVQSIAAQKEAGLKPVLDPSPQKSMVLIMFINYETEKTHLDFRILSGKYMVIYKYNQL